MENHSGKQTMLTFSQHLQEEAKKVIDALGKVVSPNEHVYAIPSDEKTKNPSHNVIYSSK